MHVEIAETLPQAAQNTLYHIKMKTYKIVNNALGWLVFAVAAFTYCSTIEPTASFWDCPEFISTAEKMEVGHPPGAPFFMLTAKFFTLFAHDASQVARMVNTMSAMLSAGCILFLFWSITHLASKLLCKDGEAVSAGRLVAIMGAGIGGALIYTWSDTFWFSAVEGEVYGYSSFFTALVFWLILKWEDQADQPHSDRWIVLIAYLVGLSIGVHLLNLLCIPAIVLVAYYKKCKAPTLRGSLLAICISALIIVAVLYGIVPGIVKVAGWFELFFVNVLGMKFNTGVFVYLVLLVASLVWALVETERGASRNRMNAAFLLSVAVLGVPFLGHGTGMVVTGVVALAVIAWVIWASKRVNARILNTALLCMTLIAVGYSSYAVIVIRSTANPPMDQDSPEDVFALEEYLGREQYGDTPLFWGPTYASRPRVVENGQGMLVYDVKKGTKRYQRVEKHSADEQDRYFVANERFSYRYPANQCMVFPRIYSDKHADLYKSWLGGVTGKTVTYQYPGQGSETLTLPTQWDNMKFFFSYQMNFMYWRYFMWNFAGRQNDLQSGGELEKGNWLTGIKVLDNLRLGDQNLLPDELKSNKGRNVFYCLPLLLGLLGFFWQAFRGPRGIQQFWVVFFLFFMTGLAIVLYLNQTPNQPRERDYAYAGSFYAFAMWCGLGVTALYEVLMRLFRKLSRNPRTVSALASVVALVPAVAVPLQMVSQTWDDHDRSDRYVCRDFGLDYLETVPHDGVIFTNGDNDTFPLWYNEDTEGKRTDVRVCNLSYLATDWYIDQMKRPAFTGEGASSPLPISWKRYDYITGQHEVTEVNPDIEYEQQEIPMKDFVRLIYSADPAMAEKIWGKEPFELNNAIKKFVLKEGIPEEYRQIVESMPSCLPSDTLYINVDKEAVRRSGMKLEGDSIPDRMYIDLGTYDGYGRKVSEKNRLYKSFMMMVEMLGQSNFSRPLYMSTTVGPSNYGGLYRHFLQEGIAWRITPYTYTQNMVQNTVADTDRMFENMMHKYKYGNLKQRGLYIDETTLRMCNTQRRWFGVLIAQLLSEGKLDKALQAADKCQQEIPSYNVPHDTSAGSLDVALAYAHGGEVAKCESILKDLDKKARQYYNWYMHLSDKSFGYQNRECYSSIYDLAQVQNCYGVLAEHCKSEAEKKRVKEKVDNYEDLLQKFYGDFAQRCAQLGINLR